MGFGNQRPPSGREYDDTNRFKLFKNDRRRDERDAAYTGSVNIDGQEYYLNGWDGTGKLVCSGTVKPKGQKGQPQRREPYQRPQQGGFDRSGDDYERPPERDDEGGPF